MLFFRGAFDALQQCCTRGGHLLFERGRANVVEVRMIAPYTMDTFAELSRLFVVFRSRRMFRGLRIVHVQRRNDFQTDDAIVSCVLFDDGRFADALEVGETSWHVGGAVDGTAIEQERGFGVTICLAMRSFLEAVLHTVDRALEISHGDRITDRRFDADIVDDDRRGFRNAVEQMTEFGAKQLHDRGFAGARSAGEHDARHLLRKVVLDRTTFAVSLAAEVVGDVREQAIRERVGHFDRIFHPLGDDDDLLLAFHLELREHEAGEWSFEEVYLPTVDQMSSFADDVRR